MSALTGVAIQVREIGLGLPVKDPYGDWARLSEVEDSGCVLVRPDLHVGWRCREAAADCTAVLGRAFDKILCGNGVVSSSHIE